MNASRKQVTSLVVIALIIAAAMTGLAGLGGAMSGYDRLGLLFIVIFLGVLVLGFLLDRAARNAMR
jgi:hypothetical protein